MSDERYLRSRRHRYALAAGILTGLAMAALVTLVIAVVAVLQSGPARPTFGYGVFIALMLGAPVALGALAVRGVRWAIVRWRELGVHAGDERRDES